MEIDFESLILGFSSASLSYLGFSENGEQVTARINLDLARQNIEIIAMLKEKTKGNLTLSEEKLIDQVLSDLRLKFVDAMRQKS
jgi:hypothetical protein